MSSLILILLGGAVGVVYTASPLGVWAAVGAIAMLFASGRGLPAGERHMLVMVLIAALVARVAAIAAMAVIAIPELSDLAVSTVAGDENYNLARALRVRDIALGLGGSRYDYFVATDEYGYSIYISAIAILQGLAGPSPFGLRLVNVVLFLAGVLVLHRLYRRAFGAEIATITLIGLAFLPSLLLTSIGILKEPLYFLAANIFLAAAWLAATAGLLRQRILAAGIAIATLLLLDEIRRSSALLAVSGLAVAFAIVVVAQSRVRVAAAVVVVMLAGTAVLAQPGARQAIASRVERIAVVHAGNVFTIGRPYKLLDEGFYVNPRSPASLINLTFEQAITFVARAAVAFIVVPLPWHATTTTDLLYLPQHLLWYAVWLLLPAGIAACWRRNRMLTAMLIGQSLTLSVALMLTNGNVGTLVRLRGLVWPYLLCLAAGGAWALLAERTGRRMEASYATD